MLINGEQIYKCETVSALIAALDRCGKGYVINSGMIADIYKYSDARIKFVYRDQQASDEIWFLVYRGDGDDVGASVYIQLTE